MANRDLAIGTRVMLSPSTRMDTNRPWNPLDTIGVVTSIIDDGSTFGGSVRVDWESYHNGPVHYEAGDSDLIPVKTTEFKSRDEARAAAQKNPSLIVADMGKDVEYRWILTTKEI